MILLVYLFWEERMRKTLMAATAAFTLAASGIAQAEELRLSHQWSTKDVRHKVAQIVADEVAAANVDLEIKIFGSKSLFKPREQYKPLSRGQLDMTVFPLSYAGGQQPAFNLTLMPGLVKNHDHAARLNTSEFMSVLEQKMADDDVMVLVHGYNLEEQMRTEQHMENNVEGIVNVTFSQDTENMFKNDISFIQQLQTEQKKQCEIIKESSEAIGDEQVLIVRDAINAIGKDKQLLSEFTSGLKRITDVIKQKATINKRKVSESSLVFPITGKCTKKYDKRKGNH